MTRSVYSCAVRRDSLSDQFRDDFAMPWDNGVNKRTVINAVHTTLDVENMPLISWVRAPGSITLSRQTGIYLIAFMV